MDLIVLDDRERLYLSPDVDDWELVARMGITVIIDLDGGLDIGVPTIPDQTLYLYFPLNDHGLPECSRLHAVGRFGATLVDSGHKVLSHCGIGFNRSALVAGMILRYLGMSGEQAVARLRERRPGALYNQGFADFLISCQLEPFERSPSAPR